MPQFDVTAPDGKTYTVNAPEGASQDDAIAYVRQNMYGGKEPERAFAPSGSVSPAVANDTISQGARDSAVAGIPQSLLDSAKNLIGGGVRGAGSIGASAMRVLPNILGGDTADENAQRRKDMDSALQTMGADPNSFLYGAGKLGAEIAGTAGAGGALASGVRAGAGALGVSESAPLLQAITNGLQTGGFRIGAQAPVEGALATAGRALGNGALRVGTGVASGAATAGLVNPNSAGMGAVIGGALPLGAAGMGAAGNFLNGMFRGNGVSPEVAALAQKAQDLGINIPADRLADSKPLNAMAASLNYIPLSGRAATEDAMNSQLNRALSNTFGQDSSNVTMALRKAEDSLGGEFERVLKGTSVNIDPQFMQDLANVSTQAGKELGADALKPIANQVNEIIEKGASGQIDGQAAYNIKRTLDRIANGNTPSAFHAVQLKQALMDALNRSLGPEEAAKFALTRQQYGNMLDLQKLAPNGGEGEVSIARIANMKNINNQPLQDIADIAAQFVKPREGMHGAAQRVSMGTAAAGLGGWMGGPLGAALSAGSVMGAGRAANSALNSGAARRYMLQGALSQAEPSLLTQGFYRTAPLLADQ